MSEQVAKDDHKYMGCEKLDCDKHGVECVEEGCGLPRMAHLRERARALYRPPFKFEGGYIWDKNMEMVADSHLNTLRDEPMAAVRIRGWGRIQSLPTPGPLQEEVGKMIAELLTKHWMESR